MPCEKYQQALIETAAQDATPSAELRAHLGVCASCGAQFAQEQQLFAAIDSAVQKMSNAEMPPSLLPILRTRMDEQKVQRSYWLPVAAMVATALIVALLVPRENKRHLTGTETQANSVATAAPTSPELSQKGTPKGFVAPSRRSVLRRSASAVKRPPEVVVLIPEGQRRAFDRLVAGLQSGQVEPDVLVVDKPEQASQEQSLSPLAIAPIEIKPLAAVDDSPAPANESSNR